MLVAHSIIDRQEICTFECLTRGYEAKTAPMPTLEEAMLSLQSKVLKRKAEKAFLYGKTDENKEQANEDEIPQPTLKAVSLLAVSKPVLDLRGHTSYLTFAVLAPEFLEEATENAADKNGDSCEA